MNIIPTSSSSFEDIVNNFIKQGKIRTLEALGKLLERIDLYLYSKKESFEKVVKIKERSIQTTIGMLRFRRRYYFDELERKYRFKLDAFLKIPKRNRLTNTVKLKIIEAASEMSYSKAARYACDDNFPVSKSTVCRLIKNTEFYVEDNTNLIINDSKIHTQIDEKCIHVLGSKRKRKLYTCTIFKGVTYKGNKRVLQNRTLISCNNLKNFFNRINEILYIKYKVSLEDEIYVSGDLARYIQLSPEKILMCKATYVPDKFHILKGLKDTLGVVANKYDLNDEKYRESTIEALKNEDNVDARKIRTLLKRKPDSIKHYLDSAYEGCSQEGMNSHYFSPRFDKVPNIWGFETIDKLSQVICSKENGSKIKIGWKDTYYDMPYKLADPMYIDKEYASTLAELDLPYEMRKFFVRLMDGRDIIDYV